MVGPIGESPDVSRIPEKLPPKNPFEQPPKAGNTGKKGPPPLPEAPPGSPDEPPGGCFRICRKILRLLRGEDVSHDPSEPPAPATPRQVPHGAYERPRAPNREAMLAFIVPLQRYLQQGMGEKFPGITLAASVQKAAEIAAMDDSALPQAGYSPALRDDARRVASIRWDTLGDELLLRPAAELGSLLARMVRRLSSMHAGENAPADLSQTIRNLMTLVLPQIDEEK